MAIAVGRLDSIRIAWYEYRSTHRILNGSIRVNTSCIYETGPREAIRRQEITTIILTC